MISETLAEQFECNAQVFSVDEEVQHSHNPQVVLLVLLELLQGKGASISC